MAVLDMLQDQDHDLIEALRQVQQLWLRWAQHRKKLDLNSLPASLHPSFLFEAFLESLGGDHLVLLDFLISHETTTFVEYFLEYLRFALQSPVQL